MKMEDNLKAMEPNIYISNGTCYSGPDLEADTSMIPCGNSFYGSASCCQAGDSCLLSGACYNGEYGTTYVAGCTDSEYNSTVCPDKFDDQDAPWLGMSYCNGTSNQWVLCDQKGHPDTLEKPDPCYCPEAKTDRTMTLSQLSTINNTASLPTATGLSIQFVAGYYPTVPATIANSGSLTSSQSATAGSSQTISGVTGTTLLSTASATAAADATRSSSGLDASQITGIAVGSAVLAVILFGVFGHLCIRDRDADHDGENGHGDSSDEPTTADTTETGSMMIGLAHGGGASPVSSPRPSELESKNARPWSMVSELDAERAVAASPGGRMEAIMEHETSGTTLGPDDDEGEMNGPSELPAQHHVVELPA